MKKIILFVVTFFLIINLNAQNFGGGNGSFVSPYRISTAEHFNSIRSIRSPFSKVYFTLMNDIDLTNFIINNNQGHGWEPIRFAENINIEGNNHKITGLWVNESDLLDFNVGLFGILSNSMVNNLYIETSSEGVKGKSNAGILCAELRGESRIESCHVNGIVEGMIAGGLIGSMGSNSTNTVLTESQSVINSSSNVRVYTCVIDFISQKSIYTIGGLIGQIYRKPSVDVVVQGSYSEGEVINNVCNRITSLGGLIGSMFVEATGVTVIANCYSTALVRNTICLDNSDLVGGLIGIVGGNSLARYNLRISECYSVGEVESEGIGGGFMGTIINNLLSGISSCYYDIETSTKENPLYQDYLIRIGVTGKRTSHMKQQSTFVGWDFDNTWKITEGITYPLFQWQEEPNLTCFEGGNGTENNPYKIRTPQQLDCFIEHASDPANAGTHYRIIENIDMYDYIAVNYSQNGWRGNEVNNFSGYLHGGGHVISGIWGYYNTVDPVGGLFAVNGIDGTIDSLGVVLASRGVSALNQVGGLVGTNRGYINSCFTMGGIVTARDGFLGIGGLVGENSSATIVDCYSTVSVVAVEWPLGGYIGGLVGYNHSNSMIFYCYSAGNVIASHYIAGGLVGRNYNANVRYCYYDSEVTRQNIGIGSDNRNQNIYVYGRTTASMKDINSVNLLDFNNTWKLLPNSYPMLKWQDGQFVPRKAELEQIPELNANDLAKFSIYPNPTNNLVNIQTDEESIEVQIYNTSGQLLIKTNNNTIDLSSYPCGIYFLNVNGTVEKIIKE